MAGQQMIDAPKQAVWDALNDPEVLKACITGCQSMEKTSENTLVATVKAAVGPVKATFKGEVELQNLNPPNSYTLAGQGKGGAAGFAKGGADVTLDEVEGGTQLSYDVKANVGGQLARIGSRLIDGAAKKYADEFFTAFKAHVEASAASDTVAEPATEEPAPEEAPEPVVAQEAPAPEPIAEPEPEVAQTQIQAEPEAETTGGIPAFVWGGALAVAIVLAIIFLM
ncbi:MAG: carbon monoxide dehydrogenase subunit G [Pseudomonadota bacterium]